MKTHQMNGLASLIASYGRGEDTMLLHVTPDELAALQGIATLHGGSLTINPITGLPEMGFLSKLWKGVKKALPAIVGIAANVFVPGISAVTTGLLVGGTSAVVNKSLKRGLVDGFTAGVFSGLAKGIGSLGTGNGVGAGGAMSAASGGYGGAAGMGGSLGSGISASSAGSGLGSLTNVAGAAGQGFKAAGSVGLQGLGSGIGSAAPHVLSGAATAGSFVNPATAAKVSETFVNAPLYESGFSLQNLARNATNKDAWRNSFGDGSKVMKAANAMQMLGGAMQPQQPMYGEAGEAGGAQIEPRKPEEYRRMYTEQDYNPDFDPNYVYNGGEPRWFGDVRTHYAEGGIVAAGVDEKAVKAIRARYRSIQDAVKDMAVQGSVINSLGIRNPQSPTLKAAFGYTVKQGKKKEKPNPFERKPFAQGGHVTGTGDGMSDSIPATIDGGAPAALSTDEYVVPADVVSHLGNGSSEAGAAHLENMVGRIRQARTGRAQQAPQIDPNKFLLA